MVQSCCCLTKIWLWVTKGYPPPKKKKKTIGNGKMSKICGSQGFLFDPWPFLGTLLKRCKTSQLLPRSFCCRGCNDWRGISFDVGTMLATPLEKVTKPYQTDLQAYSSISLQIAYLRNPFPVSKFLTYPTTA